MAFKNAERQVVFKMGIVIHSHSTQGKFVMNMLRVGMQMNADVTFQVFAVWLPGPVSSCSLLITCIGFGGTVIAFWVTMLIFICNWNIILGLGILSYE